MESAGRRWDAHPGACFTLDPPDVTLDRVMVAYLELGAGVLFPELRKVYFDPVRSLCAVAQTQLGARLNSGEAYVHQAAVSPPSPSLLPDPARGTLKIIVLLSVVGDGQMRGVGAT